jgi:hypothetical protein
MKLFTLYNSEKDRYKKLLKASQREASFLKQQVHYFDDHTVKLNSKLEAIEYKIKFLLNDKGSVVNTQKSYSCKGVKLMLNNLLK